MSRPRITIAGLLMAVALVAVAFASLRQPTAAWDAALLALTLLVLLASVLLAVHRTGGRRAYWLGFALFGWTYLTVSLVSSVESRLPTTKALVAVRAMLARPEDDWEDALMLWNVRSFDVTTAATTAPNPPGGWDVTVFQQPAPPSTSYIKRLVGLPGETAGNFVRTGHSLFALSFALVGGFLSRRLYLGPGVTRRPSDIAVPCVGGQDDRGGPGDLADDHGTPPRAG